MSRQEESRSQLALGLQWASRITTIALEFSMPMVLGYGVDRWLQTTPAATITGLLLGFVAGMLHTFKIASEPPGGSKRSENHSRGEGVPPSATSRPRIE